MKSALCMLLLVLFLVAMPVVAEDLEFSNLVGSVTYETLSETKIITQEVAEFQAVIYKFDDLAPPTGISYDLPFPGTEKGIIELATFGLQMDFIQKSDTVLSAYRLAYYCMGGDCFGGSIPDFIL